MARQIVTLNNIRIVEYTALVELLHPIYCKDIPEVNINKAIDLQELESLMIFFSNQYAYMVELWAVMNHEVRLLKRTSANKDAIAESMDKRDYLEKVMSATKLKYYSSSRLLKYHSNEEGVQ